MNCLKKICHNQKICKIYPQIKELQSVIFRLDFDCEFFNEMHGRRLEPDPIESQTTPGWNSRFERLKEAEAFLNADKTKLQTEEKSYICSVCGSEVTSSELASLDTEYDLDTESQKEVALCIKCARGTQNDD